MRANMIASLDGGATVDGRSAAWATRPTSTCSRCCATWPTSSWSAPARSGPSSTAASGSMPPRRARRLRWGLSAAPPPIAVVTGRGLDPSLPLFTDTETPPIVITTAAARRRRSGRRRTIIGRPRSGELSRDAIGALGAAGFRRIHCEGGPGLLGSLVAADLLDECCLTIAPMLLGSGAPADAAGGAARPGALGPGRGRVGGDHLFTRYRRPVTADASERTGRRPPGSVAPRRGWPRWSPP